MGPRSSTRSRTRTEKKKKKRSPIKTKSGRTVRRIARGYGSEVCYEKRRGRRRRFGEKREKRGEEVMHVTKSESPNLGTLL